MSRFNPLAAIGRLFDNKKFLVAFSLVCAVIFWLVIDITENPLRDITVGDVPITIADQTDDNGNVLSPIGSYTDAVTVTLNGPGYMVSKITKDDINVSVSSYADVTKPGTYVLSFVATTGKSGCNVTKISPSYIKVVYDYDTSSDIPVEIDTAEFQQYVDADCEIYKSSLRSNSNGDDITALTVSGPSEVIGSIAKVVVKPILPASDIESTTQNFSGSTVFYDVVGNEVDDSQLVYNTDTYVRIVVYKTADAVLVPTFANMPECFASSDSGLPPYKITAYDELQKHTESINHVKVRGPVDSVNELSVSGLKLSAIDFSKVKSGSTSFNVSFLLPDNVEVVDGTEEVTVSLELGKLTTKTLTVQPSAIKFEGLGDGLSASTSYKKAIKVVICGKYNVLRGITANDIVLTVNCNGVTTATIETKGLKAAVSGGSEAWVNSVEPSEISIVIE